MASSEMYKKISRTTLLIDRQVGQIGQHVEGAERLQNGVHALLMALLQITGIDENFRTILVERGLLNGEAARRIWRLAGPARDEDLCHCLDALATAAEQITPLAYRLAFNNKSYYKLSFNIYQEAISISKSARKLQRELKDISETTLADAEMRKRRVKDLIRDIREYLQVALPGPTRLGRRQR